MDTGNLFFALLTTMLYRSKGRFTEVFLAMNTIDAFASEISRRIRETLDELSEDF